MEKIEKVEQLYAPLAMSLSTSDYVGACQTTNPERSDCFP